MTLLSQPQWIALTRLYAAGEKGIPYHAGAYAEAGSWPTIKQLRDHEPSLAREITRLDPYNQTTHYLVIITDAGKQFYEKHRRFYNAIYFNDRQR